MNSNTSTDTAATITVAGYHEYWAAQRGEIVAQHVTIEARDLTDLAEAEALVSYFPKSAKLRPSTCTVITEAGQPNLELGSAHVSIKLLADGANGGRNETGIKRLHAILKAADRAGIAVEYRATAGNAVPSLAELLALIAEPAAEVAEVATVEPGAGCGTGSDGQACSPAYLCPACIDLLIAADDARRTAEREHVRTTYGDQAAELLANGWTVDSAISHVSGTCDLEACTGDHGHAWAVLVAEVTGRPEAAQAERDAELARSMAAVRDAAVAAGRQDVVEALDKLEHAKAVADYADDRGDYSAVQATAAKVAAEVAEHHATFHQPHDVTTMATFIAECHQCTWRFVGSQADSTAARAEHEREAADVVGRHYARR